MVWRIWPSNKSAEGLNEPAVNKISPPGQQPGQKTNQKPKGKPGKPLYKAKSLAPSKGEGVDRCRGWNARRRKPPCLRTHQPPGYKIHWSRPHGGWWNSSNSHNLLGPKRTTASLVAPSIPWLPTRPTDREPFRQHSLGTTAARSPANGAMHEDPPSLLSWSWFSTFRVQPWHPPGSWSSWSREPFSPHLGPPSQPGGRTSPRRRGLVQELLHVGDGPSTIPSWFAPSRQRHGVSGGVSWRVYLGTAKSGCQPRNPHRGPLSLFWHRMALHTFCHNLSHFVTFWYEGWKRGKVQSAQSDIFLEPKVKRSWD